MSAIARALAALLLVLLASSCGAAKKERVSCFRRIPRLAHRQRRSLFFLAEAKPKSFNISVNLNRTARAKHISFSGIDKPRIVQVGVPACEAD